MDPIKTASQAVTRKTASRTSKRTTGMRAMRVVSKRLLVGSSTCLNAAKTTTGAYMIWAPPYPAFGPLKCDIEAPGFATMVSMAASAKTAVPPLRLDDFEPAAREILPRAIYDYFAGGAEDEAAVVANRDAFRRYRFRFKVLASTLEPEMSCELLGDRFAMPVH